MSIPLRPFRDYPTILKPLSSFGPYRAMIAHWRDGDTVELHIDLGFHQPGYVAIRLKDIKAPELRETGGPEALAMANTIAPVGTWCVVHSQVDRSATSFTRTFDRFVGNIIIVWRNEIRDIGDVLVESGTHVRVS